MLKFATRHFITTTPNKPSPPSPTTIGTQPLMLLLLLALFAGCDPTFQSNQVNEDRDSGVNESKQHQPTAIKDTVSNRVSKHLTTQSQNTDILENHESSNPAIQWFGKLLTDDGSPISQATLLLSASNEDEPVAQVQTNGSGEFRMIAPKGAYSLELFGLETSNSETSSMFIIDAMPKRDTTAVTQDIILSDTFNGNIIVQKNQDGLEIAIKMPSEVQNSRTTLSTAASVSTPQGIAGTVYGGSIPLPDVAITVLENGTSTILASTVTDAVGMYTITIDDGTYDLQVTPVAGSAFGETLIQDVQVAGSTQQDIVLLSLEAITIEGILRGHGGEPVPNSDIQLRTQNASIEQVTDDNGHFSFSVSPGSYQFYARQTAAIQSVIVPTTFAYWSNYGDYTQDTTLDIQLPVVKLTGTVKGNDDQTIAEATIQAYSYYTASTEYDYCSSSQTATSDADGNYTVLLLEDNDVNVTVTPPAGAPYGTTVTQLNFFSDMQQDLLLSNQITIEGVVRGHEGVLATNVRLHLQGDGINQYQYTKENGAYAFNVSPGRYEIDVTRGNATDMDHLPVRFNYYGAGIQYDQSTVHDIQLPVVKLEGTLQGYDGQILTNAQCRILTDHSNSNYRLARSDNTVTSDTAGGYSLLIFEDPTAKAIITPEDLEQYAMTIIETDFIEDGERDFVAIAAMLITGVLRGHAGNPVANARIYLENGDIRISQYTDTNGVFSFSISPYRLRFRISKGRQPHSAFAPGYYSWLSEYKQFTSAVQEDIQLPVVQISGTTVDSNGAPVPSVTLLGSTRTLMSNPFINHQSVSSVSSDANGLYSLLLFEDNSMSLSITPPSQSGFSITGFSNMSLLEDIQQSIVLQRPDLSAPLIVAGPTVVHLSDSSVSINWSTNEATNAAVDFGIGTLSENISQSVFNFDHSVTLTGLHETTTYQYQVSSADEAGNGPTQSQNLEFTTQAAPGDITPPVITDGPYVSFTDQTTAIIQWETDEPATSELNWGPSESLDHATLDIDGIFHQSHTVTLDGLSACTKYYYRAMSSDPDENGPTLSETLNFETKTVPDTAPPVVISGPHIEGATHNTITVSWETDEPATSGISYTDGEVYDLVQDNSLVTQHSITLAGLAAQTTFAITVSSSDAVGNGPTLGGPIDGTTLAVPDTQGPLISDLAIQTEETSATLSWLTDEPATSKIEYGITPGNYDNITASASLKIEHELLLTGLTPGVTYYGIITSVDAASNETTTMEQTFSTGAPDTDGDGTPDDIDGCPTDPQKIEPAQCGCFILDTDSDDDETADCNDGCPGDPTKIDPGICGCGAADTDSDGDETADCNDGCPGDPTKIEPGICGCGISESTPPVFTFVPADLTTDQCENTDIGTALAEDDCGVTITNDAPSHFPLGTSLVTWTAKDNAGNKIAATQLVTAVLGDDPSCCPIGTNIIQGTEASDVLVGTNGSDCVILGAGDDVFNGYGGNDYIFAGPGRDTIDSGDGNDYVSGGPGDDVIFAGHGDDTVNGGTEHDVCFATPGQDNLINCETQP